MRRRNTAINAIQSLYDENVELKQKLDLFTKTETNKNHPQKNKEEVENKRLNDLKKE